MNLICSILLAATIAIEHNPASFSCAANDTAAKATVSLIAGTLDRNSAPLAVLTDGALPTEEDQPSANVFFAADTWGGRIRLDFATPIDIASIHTYSRHPDTRGPQLYKVYGSIDPRDPAPSSKLDPESVGWTLIAFVDTRANEGGAHVVHLSEVGRYRYLLFDVFETESDDAYGNTFYSEFDVNESRSAATPVAALE
ncbi:MAG TPA: hypothetical protein VGD79_04490 [Thermoanaerobaculia bacterium]|jgi:hypothetical protein